MQFKAIDDKKRQLDALRPLPKHSIQSLRENLLLNWIYNSNAIEGNTLTINETKVVLEGLTIGGKSISEHLEVINHKEAILYLESLAQEDTPLSEYHIKGLHSLILKGIDNDNAGRYRREMS